MKSLTDISQGFDKCTKATLQNNYFWGTPPNDYFCLETWSRYYYNIKRRKFKTILIWRSSRKMSRNKNYLYILYIYMSHIYYLWKKLSKFSMFFLFNFVPQQNLNVLDVLFMFHLEKPRESLVLNLSILAEIFCVLFTFMSSIASDWKNVQVSWTFFSVARMK